MIRTLILILIILLPLSAATQSRCIIIGYSQFAQITKKHSYYNTPVGGKSTGYGFHLAHTSIENRYFLSTIFQYTFSRDSIVIWNLYAPPKRSEQQLKVLDIGFNFGILIPQHLNDFVSVYLGGGLHYARIYWDHPGIAAHSAPGVTTELLARISYEFEKFYLTGSYSYLFTINELDTISHRNGFRFGITIPYRRW